MFWKIKSGTLETIQGYDCWIPPVGYGCHSESEDIKKTDVLKRSTNKFEQYWERTPLPEDWNKKRKTELIRQEADADYYDPDLEKFREQEWNRRLYGVWFYNLGNPTYVTGEHYMYLNWWPLDDGYPSFREPDRKRYYVLQYCVQDPKCAGMVEASNRRSGKSYRGALFTYDFVSRHTDVNGGIQSKTDKDAKNLFKGKVVTPFKRMPDFFRPEIDTMAGNNPEKELKFTTTTRRGAAALKYFSDLGLNSFLNFLSSDQYAYDGWKLYRYLGDEVGKTAEVDVYERWRVVKYCLRVGGKWIGKALLTTTVEKLKGEITQTEAFKHLWQDSDSSKRNANGETISGLYKFFTPAFEMYEWDKYGFPLVEAGKQYYLNLRAGLQHDPRALASEIAKNPFSEDELFYSDADRCLYDLMTLNSQLSNISWKENLTEKGNFVWKNNERFGEVEWKQDNQGRWEILRGHVVKNTNKVINQNGKYIPNNNFAYRIGCDPFKYDKAKDSRRSDSAALVYKMFDLTEPSSPFNDAFVCKYKYRAASTAIQYEDVLKMSWYYGCQVLFERNVDNWKDYFQTAKCQGFLMKLPGEEEPGMYSDGHGKTHQILCGYTEAYINEHIKKVWFKDLIKDWIEFKIEKTTEYDLAMASGYTLVAKEEKVYKRTVETTHDITRYFRTYKAS
jgi:hypothetical protein